MREFLIAPEEGGKVEDLDLTVIWGMVSITQRLKRFLPEVTHQKEGFYITHL